MRSGKLEWAESRKFFDLIPIAGVEDGIVVDLSKFFKYCCQSGQRFGSIPWANPSGRKIDREDREVFNLI